MRLFGLAEKKEKEKMNRKEFDSAINSLLENAEQKIPEEDLPALPPMELCSDVPDWYDFESELWEIGENMRQIICSERKDLNHEQAERVCLICLNRNAKRGRQSFVMLLGKKRFNEYADRLADLLSDDDVNGHVLDSIYKMGAPQYCKEAEPFLTSEHAWIRKTAKRYIEKYS